MIAPPTADRQPFFMECDGRRLFAVYHPPVRQPENQAGAVFFAPFGEEMNRARRMATLLAQALAAAGTGTLVFDYSCTGDSEGRFGEARWDDWVEDGVAAMQWLSRRLDGPITPVGLRLGCAVALYSAGRCGRPIGRTILWQPVTSGQAMLTQFLRIRIATGMRGEAERETTSTLRQRLDDGETLEIGGYEISPELARAIDAIKLMDFVPERSTRLSWFEVAAEPSADTMPASRPVIESWRNAGINLSAATVAGEPFWSTQEIATAPSLVDATVHAMARVPA